MTDSYRQLFLYFKDAVFVEDATGVILEANAAAARLFGLPSDQLIGCRHQDFLSPVTIERLEPQIKSLKPFERLQFDAQYVFSGREPVNAILDVSFVLWENTQAYMVVARESMKRDELERELRLQRQSAGADGGPCAEATFFLSSRNELCRYPPPAPGQEEQPLDWVHTLLRGPQLKPAIDRAWHGETLQLPPAWYAPPAPDASQSSSILNSRTTPHVWLKFSILPLRLRGLEVTDVCVRVVDATSERLAHESERRRSQRISLALSISTLNNEVNNFLSVILAHASSLGLTLFPGQLPPPNVGAIIDAAQQAAALLRRSNELGLHNEGRLPEQDLNALLDDSVHLLHHVFNGHLRIETDFAPNLPKVRGDADLLRSLIVILGRQARPASPKGGRLIFRTFVPPSTFPGIPPSAGLSIEDHGATGAVLGHGKHAANDPLDLAVARAIVRHHQGQLETANSSAQGTVWEVTLPGIEERNVPAPDSSPALAATAPLNVEAPAELRNKHTPTSTEKPTPAADPLPPTREPGRNRILLADDEENFRLFTSWVLRERGYEVVAAADGQEAFERFQENPASFVLVILDAYMPRMGGLETYLRMQVVRPELPVLFASGFVRGPTMEALVEGCPGPAGVILKPFSSEDLLKAVKNALTPKE